MTIWLARTEQVKRPVQRVQELRLTSLYLGHHLLRVLELGEGAVVTN